MNPTAPVSSASSAAQRGAQWLIELIQEDGSLRGASSLNEYYKVPFGLVATGHYAEADRVLDYVATRYLQPDGDLDGTGCSWFESFRVYAHGWLIMASLIRGRFEMAHSLLRKLATYHDARTGGFFATTEGRDGRSGIQEIMTTALAGIACLWAGRLDLAESAGTWMRNVWEAQPDLSKGLYFVWDPGRGLVTEFPADDARSYVVDAQKVRQRYYQYGISAALLAGLAGATGNETWLEAARRFLRASQYCQEDVYRQPQSGKIGWGAAWAFRLSGDTDDCAIAEKVVAGLRALRDQQHGWWSGLNVYDREMAAQLVAAIDVTGEFVGLLGMVEPILASHTWPVPGKALHRSSS